MKPNILILTGYTDEIKDIGDLCLPSKQAWADRWGCTFLNIHNDDYDEKSHPSFQKIEFIRYAMNFYDFVIWLDADSLITNENVPPWHLTPGSTRCVSVSLDYADGGRILQHQWSAGNMAWRLCPESKAWLDAAMQQHDCKWSGLWDQDALQRTQPEGAVMYRGSRIMNAVHPSINTHARWRKGDFLIHFTGFHVTQRARIIREFMEGKQ